MSSKRPISNPYIQQRTNKKSLPSQDLSTKAVSTPNPPAAATDASGSIDAVSTVVHIHSFSQAFPVGAELITPAANNDDSELALYAERSEPSLSDRDYQQYLPSSGSHLLVHQRQRGNTVLTQIRNVPIQEENQMVPDYIMGTTRCALFLSCRYHALYPQYIHRRIAELGNDFTLRVLLVLVDDPDPCNTLLYINKLACQHNLTLVLSWSDIEAARYLETFKAMDGKDAQLIQKRTADKFGDQVADVLSKAGVNKTDAAQLLSQFSTFQAIANATVDELATVSGMGQVKVRRVWEAFHKPFSSRRYKKKLLQGDNTGDTNGVSSRIGDGIPGS